MVAPLHLQSGMLGRAGYELDTWILRQGVTAKPRGLARWGPPWAPGWGPSQGAPAAVPEQKLLLLMVLREPPEELGGLNSRLSSSEKGDSEAGDTFCCGRRTRRGMRLRAVSFSSCVFCSCSGRDTSASGMRPPPATIPAGAGEPQPPRPCLSSVPAAAWPPLTLLLSRRGPIAPQSPRSRGQAPGMGEEDALSPGCSFPLLLLVPLRRWGWRSPARPRRSPAPTRGAAAGRAAAPGAAAAAPRAPSRCGDGAGADPLPAGAAASPRHLAQWGARGRRLLAHPGRRRLQGT